jgi:parallel beta-helix repeat protein
MATPGSYGSDNERYQAINNSIKNIENSVSNGDILCGGKYIKLLNGTYDIGNNTLQMGECVAIRGNGRDSTTIQGKRKSVISFSQKSHGSSLQDLTVTADNDPKNNACIWIIDDSPLIKNIKVEKCWDGIRIGGGLHDPVNHPARPTITASRIVYNTHIGIGNNVASDAWIVNNRIYGNQYNGIGVLDIAAPRIENNIIGSAGNGGAWSEGNGNMGIGVWDNSSPSIIGNSILVNNIGGIGVRGNATPNILNNTIASNDYGIMAYEWSEPLVYYNIIRNNLSFANAAQDSVIWEVKYNEIFGSPTGIAMMDDATGLVEGNYVYSNSLSSPTYIEAGIAARGGVDTSIYNNWVVDNAMKGIAFMDIPSTANILVRYNYIARNASDSGTTGNFGLSITGSELGSSVKLINYGNFIIDKNVILDNKDGGVGFKDFGGTVLFDNNIVASNTATHTTAGGISFFSPTDANINLSANTFYNNKGVHGGAIGVSFGNAGTTSSVNNNVVYWNKATASDYSTAGIGFLDSLGDIYISGNVVHSNDAINSSTDSGIGLRWINAPATSTANAIQILNNTVYSHRNTEAELAGMAEQDEEGLNNRAGIAVRNITFDNTTGYLTISGNTVNNNTTGIRVRGDNPAASSTGSVSISNNVINSSRLNGILVQANGIQYPTYVIGNNLDNSGIVSNGLTGGRAGVRVREVDESVIVKGNSLVNFGKSGIRCRSIQNGQTTYIENNVVGSVVGTGIGVSTILSNAAVSISNNLVYSTANPNTGYGADPDDGGISISTIGNTTDTWIFSNELRYNGSNTGIGGMGFYSQLYSATASGVKITLDNNTIWSNIGDSGGGVGFTNINATISIINNSIHNNASTSTNKGVGGIGFMESGGSVVIDNNVIYSNTTANTQPD